MGVRYLSILGLLVTIFAISCGDIGKEKRYGIKKGILVSESIYSHNQANITLTLHFDDYGSKEYTIASSEMGINGVIKRREQHSLLDGEFLYSWDSETKKGSKYNYAEVLDPFKLSKEDFTDDLKKQFNFKEVGTEIVMGKQCEVISLSFNGVQGKMYSWKNILLKSEVSSQGMKIVTLAKSLDENPDFDKKLFELPGDTIEFSDFIMPKAPPRNGSLQ